MPLSKSNQWTAWVNNTQRFTTTTNTPGFPPTNGRLMPGDSTILKYFVGEISEMMIFDRELTAAERDGVATNYFSKHFNLW